MAKYVLGLDMGITSVGWGLIDADTGEIIDKGVRLFKESNAAENATRRSKRGLRRLKRRRQQRIIELKRFLKKENILLNDYKPLNNVYELRVKGLNNQLTKNELSAVILNIAKKRGSSLDVVEDDAKIEKLNEEGSKKSLNINEMCLLKEHKSVCEKQLEELNKNGKIRGNTNIYRSSSYEKELRTILETQKMSDGQIEKILNIIFRRRDFNEGPGDANSPSIYGRFIPKANGEIETIGSMIEKMKGKCSIYGSEPRASKMALTADIFNLLNDLNNLTIDREDEIDEVTEEEKRCIINEYVIPKGKITIKEICKVLGANEAKISGFREKDDKPIITDFKGYQKVLKAVNNEILPIKVVDNIIDILTEHKEIEKRVQLLSTIECNKLDDEKIKKLSNLSGIQGYHSLSYKAMDTMLPELYLTNDNQMQILTRMNLLKNDDINLANRKTIPSYSDKIYSPVAKRVHNETIKVMNAIIKEYGELDSIVIEMARDRNSKEQKKRIEEANKIGLRQNELALEKIEGTGVKPNSKLIQKIRLYEEQDGISLYSGKPIDFSLLIHDPTAYEIDHIIPLSISLDDSANNKTLVLRAENQDKLNRTPFQYLLSGECEGWGYNKFEQIVLQMYGNKKINKRKLQNLLYKGDITKEEVRKNFINRNLVDTRYASRVVLNLLQDYFKANNKKTKVFTIRGQITSMFRKSRKLNKSRDTFYHHIIDALIVAYSRKFNYINELMEYGFKYTEKIDEETGEIVRKAYDLFDYKDDNFTLELRKLNEINSYNENIKISHKVDRKPNRQFTDETIYSAKLINGEFQQIQKYKNIYDKDGIKFANEIKKNLNDEEKLNKFLMKKEDPVTFNLLVDIVKNAADFKNESPFKKYCDENNIDGIRKKSKKGLGPKITSVRYYAKRLYDYLDITHKYNNVPSDTKIVLLKVYPFRTDFYKNKEGLYKFLTVRYKHLKEGKNGYIISDEVYKKLKVEKKIDDTFEFMFSLYENEFVKIVNKDKINETNCIYRFVGTNADKDKKVQVKHIYMDQIEEKSRIMVTIGKDISDITKYDVDVLGNRIAKKRDKNLQLEV